MKPLRFLLAALLLSASSLRASAESEALAALDAAGAQASASSAIRSPSLNNFDRVRGELGALPPFFQRLAEKLGGLQVGPSARVRELSLSLGVKMEEAGKTTSVNINALIESCRGIAADLDAFNALLPQLRSALTQRLDQGAAEALDQVQVRIDLVGPIDRQVEFRQVAGVGERDAQRAGQLGGAFGRGHAADFQTGLDAGAQGADERQGRPA